MTIKIVSACLAGLNCRYDCASKEQAFIKAMVEKGEAIAVCPEQMGGLPTPRTPAEIMGEQVISKSGEDVTQNYLRGALEAFKIVEMSKASEAYLKSKSPMCGGGLIYDGTHTGQLTRGDGIFTKLLKENGITIHSVD